VAFDVAQEIGFELYGGYHSLPTEQQHQLRDLAERIEEALMHDDDFNEGVAETFRDEFLTDHVLPSCGPELVNAIHEETLEQVLRLLVTWGQTSRSSRDKALFRQVYAKVREIQQDGPQTYPGDAEPGVNVQLAAAKARELAAQLADVPDHLREFAERNPRHAESFSW
jgi:hypothetical protein